MAAIICADCRKTSLIDNVKGSMGDLLFAIPSFEKAERITCLCVCKFGLQRARRGARFCSDACRQWSYRERRFLRMGGGGGQISGVIRMRTGGPGSHARSSAFF